MTNQDAFKYLNSRGVEICRGCNGEDLVLLLDLETQPLANYLPRSSEEIAKQYPLALFICMDCGLGQIGESVSPDQIFSDYPYLSSMSSYWLEHASKFATAQIEKLKFENSDWVLEIASNDGYLLKFFKDANIDVLGIEPAENVAEIAIAKGVETISKFFGLSTAKELFKLKSSPRLIVANNVFAHVPDMQDFLAGISFMCDENTRVSIENPSFINLLNLGQFDTIYHEHFSYLTAHSVSKIAMQFGLDLYDVEQLETHGGSNRYWLAKSGIEKVSDSVHNTIRIELEQGLLSETTHDKFRITFLETVSGLISWLEKNASSRVFAYGAAAKGNTLLNAAKVKSGQIAAVFDASPEKQGKFLPGSQIPILNPEELAESAPSDLLILPWNISKEVTKFVGKASPDTACWIAVPTMTRVN